MTQMSRPDAFQTKTLLGIQAVLVLVGVAVALPFGASVAIAVLIGGGACLVSNAIFAAWVFGPYRAQEPARLVMRFYVAEAIKIAVVLGVFVVAFVTLRDLNMPALLGAYLGLQFLSTLMAARWDGRTTK